MRTPDDPPERGGPSGPRPDTRGPQPAFNVPPATLALSAAILATFLILRVVPEAWAARAVEALAVIPAKLADAVAVGDPPAIAAGFGTLISYALIHLDWPHVLMNLGLLLAFGSALERALGGRAFLAVFWLAAAGGAAVQLAVDWGMPILVFGASGGVSGAIGGVIRLMLGDPRNARRRRLGFTLLTVIVALDLLFGLLGGAVFGVDAAIAWQTHLGGLVVGLLLVRPPRLDISV